MYKIGKALLLLCSLTSASEIAAQTVSGKLIDDNKQPLPYANVVLLSLPDSTFVTGTVTAEDGTFSLNTTIQNQLCTYFFHRIQHRVQTRPTCQLRGNTADIRHTTVRRSRS